MFRHQLLRLLFFFKCSQALALALVYYFSIGSGAIAVAQVLPDETLPNNTQVIKTDNLIKILDGTTVGDNLFHSFEQFSVLSEQTAFFDNAVSIENIIGRVTGGSLSNIEGLIKANGTANLFLINPNGIVFGENAALNIGGSFIGSTADSIQFADGSQFSASNPQANPLLTVSIPVGLQYGANPQDIKVEGSGNNLTLNNQVVVTDDRPVGLEVKSGETLALVGNNVTLEGGNITASEGRIELGSVGSNGTVKLNSTDTGWQLNYSDVATFGEIALSQAASVDVSGNGGGDVQLRANQITITDGSTILASTLGDGTGGTVTITASEAIQLVGTNANNSLMSSINAYVNPNATGKGSDVVVKTHDLSIVGGAQIAAATFDKGNAGDLTVTAKNIELAGATPLGNSGLFTPVAPFAQGNGGNLNVTANTLKVRDGAQILASTFGLGDAGNLTIKAKEIEVTGFSPGGPSGLLNSTESLSPNLIAKGNGGNLTIVTDTLRVANGGQIASSSISLGNAGVLSVQAQEIELDGTTPFGSSGLFSSAFFLTGNGGNIDIATDKLSIQNGAIISASNFQSAGRIPPGEGKAGNITINADTITLDNTDIETPSRITASTFQAGGGNIELNADSITIQNNSQVTAETQGTGKGGAVLLTADSVKFDNGAKLSTNTSGAGDAGQVLLKADNSLILAVKDTGIFSQAQVNSAGNGGQITIEADSVALTSNAQVDTSTFGTGNGGAVNVNTDSLQLTDQGTISSSSTASGQAGNINLTATNFQTNQGQVVATSEKTGGGSITINSDFIYLDNQSLVSTSVNDSNGGGGNISINSNSVVANRNSDIRANAIFGPGGNIDISTEVIFASSNSEIDASSEFGIDGVVEVTSPETDRQIGIIELPANVQDPTNLITATCPIQKNNVMVVSGKGGLAENPGSFLRGQSVWQDTRLILPEIPTASTTDTNSANRIMAQEKSFSEAGSAIIEAKGWMVNTQGNVELLTHSSQQLALGSWYQTVSCQDVSQSQ